MSHSAGSSFLKIGVTFAVLSMNRDIGVPCSKRQGGSKVESAFHPPKVGNMSTRNFWELRGKE